MGLFDLYSETADTSAPNPISALPSTLVERVTATAAETFSPDRYFTAPAARQEMWQRAADELYTATGKRYAVPGMGPGVSTENGVELNWDDDATRQQKIIEASRLARAEGNDDLFDPENIDRYIAEEAQRRRDTSARLQGTGNGIGNFIAGMALESVTPHGLAGFLIPVSRLPEAAASVIGSTFLANVGKEAALQAGANAGLQAAAEGADYLSRSRFGTQQTPGEIAESVASAGLFGGILGGGVRALHLKWLGLPEKVRAEAPLEVRDAFQTIETQALYSGQNRLGIDPGLHEQMQSRANEAALKGNPLDVTDLAARADTPMTALGTIMRAAPGEIRVEGLGSTLERVQALPDSEIEATARQLKPQSFAALDRIDADLAKAQGRLGELRTGLETVTTADIVDPLTGARLADIEQRLQAPALRAREKADLERERGMIMSSIDPEGKLAGDLEKARAEVETPAEATERQALTERVESLQRERAVARKDADNEVAALRSKVDQVGTKLLKGVADDVSPDALAQEFGATNLTGLHDALQRAELGRQMRVIGEGGMPERPPMAPDRSPEAKAATEITPEGEKAREAETTRIIEGLESKDGKMQMEVQVGGRTMSAQEAISVADQQAKDARIALGCAMGSL